MKKWLKILIAVLFSAGFIAFGIYGLHRLKLHNQNKRTIDVYPVSELAYDPDMWGGSDVVNGYVSVNQEQKVYINGDSVVDEIKVKAGDHVKAGSVMMSFDTSKQQIALELKASEVEIARANIELAQVELEELRNKKPVEKKPPTTEAPTEATTETPADPTATGTDASNDQSAEADANQTPQEQESVPEDDPDAMTQEEINEAIKAKEQEIEDLVIAYQLQEVAYEIQAYQAANGDVYANFSGIVKEVNDPDTAAAENKPLIVLGGENGYTVTANVGELSLAKVPKGAEVTMFCYDMGMNYNGVVTEVSEMPVEDGGYGYGGRVESYYPVKIAIMGDTTGLSQNMYMEISLPSSKEAAEASVDPSATGDIQPIATYTDASSTDAGYATYTDATYSDAAEDIFPEIGMEDNAPEGEGNGSTICIVNAFVKREGNRYYVMKNDAGFLRKTYVKRGRIIGGYLTEIKEGITYDDYLAIPYMVDAEDGVRCVIKSTSDLY